MGLLELTRIKYTLLKSNNSDGERINAKRGKSSIKINKLLEQSGWRFFDNEMGRANIVLEPV